jgi:hypothetical protein
MPNFYLRMAAGMIMVSFQPNNMSFGKAARLLRRPIVHFANSAHLLDMFTQAHVRDFRFRMFTDRLVFVFAVNPLV